MLQNESTLWNGDNSNWLLLKIFHLYRTGFKKQGSPSFFILGSIRARKRLPAKLLKIKKKRRDRATKAFACILLSRSLNTYKDGQTIQTSINAAVNFTRKLIRSRQKLKLPCLLATRRGKYIKLAKHVI